MKKIIKIITLVSVFLFNFKIIFANSGDIDFILSPIKHEIKANPGDSITKTVKIINLGEKDAKIKTFTANFFSDGTTGAPAFAKNGDIPNPNTELASWITIGTKSFNLGVGKERYIDFIINIPPNATPGGHYGAVFLNYDGNVADEGLKINADYGSLILLTVSGNIIDDGNQGNVGVEKGVGGSISEETKDYLDSVSEIKDNCSIDLTDSDTDGKCFDSKEVVDYIEDLTSLNSAEEKNDNKNNKEKQNEKLKKDEENITFNIPFNNEGNTHIKPKGKIIIKDKNGQNLESVGKEYIKDKDGIIVGERIVDYIPINDEGGNVLPSSERIFKTSWEGIFSIEKDKNGEAIVIPNSPKNYFSDKYSTDRKDLYPWERVCEKQETDILTAIIKTSYKKYNGEEVEFNSAKEFKVIYKKKYIGINPYFVILVLLGLFTFFMFWFIVIYKRKKICKKCGEKIKRNTKKCPYCGKKQ